MTTIPNLDAMDERDLEQFARDLTRLARYSFMKCSAIRNRLEGRPLLAMLDEEDCQRIYNTLNPDWRW